MTLSRYQELGKSGELCLAGSDQGQGTWGKGGKKSPARISCPIVIFMEAI